MPIVRDRGVTTRDDLKIPGKAYNKGNVQARELMKRYMKGRNRESSMNSYEKQKFEMKDKKHLRVPVLSYARESRTMA